MPHYYFDIVAKTEAFPDAEGITLPNDAAAHEYAINLIAKTMLYDPGRSRGRRIDILDARQALVLTVLYPCREPQRPRRTFGRRIQPPLNLLNLLCVACSMFFGDTPKQAVAGSSVSCIRSGGALICTTNDGSPTAAVGILHVEPVYDAHERANRAAREQKWKARCRPILREDKYGVTRYHYSASGCEFGKTED